MEKTTVVNPTHYNEDLADKLQKQPENVHPELKELDDMGAYDGLIEDVTKDKK